MIALPPLRQVCPLRRGLAPVALALVLGACRSDLPDPPPPPVAVRSVTAASRDFADTLDTVSTLEAVEEVNLATQAPGRIQQLLVRQGDRVEAAQLLMVLDQAQQRAEVARLRAEVDMNRINDRRYDWLVRQGAVSALQRDGFRQQYLSSRQALEARQADLGFRELRAPIAGVVGDLQVKPGDVVAAGDPFAVIIRNTRLMARIDVPAVLADRVRPGQSVLLEDPIRGGLLARGVVASIDPAVAPASQSLLVKAAVANPTGRLRNGQRSRTRLVFDQRRQLAVPFAAVTRQAGQSFVFELAERRGTTVALQRPVRLGPLQNDHYPVLSGLAPGTTVITSNLINLRDGVTVRRAKG
ncbi:MAG: efflux RND transporter periplasmic adaptor subunit [Cyanobacteriota bacterium]|nr:efflux RND transporter periplasmic adaptor subunit [Cyanobacteriota bacterium]